MTSPRPVRALSFHATYRCRHSGACCTSNWPIPIEADRLARVRAALASGSLRVPRSGAADIFTHETTDDGALLGVSHNACVFFDVGAGHLCAIQRVLGHDALPLACRQFPRVTVADPRGISVTLSHYCPTAAAMLASESPVTVVTSAAAFPNDGEYVGLDATTSLPPMLRPGVLMDWESWWDVERLAVTHLSRHDGDSGGNADEPRRRSSRTFGRGVRTRARCLRASAPRSRRQCLLGSVHLTTSGARPDARSRSTRCPSIFATASRRSRRAARRPPRPSCGVFSRLTPSPTGRRISHRACGRGCGRSKSVYALAASTGEIRTADLVLRHLVDPAAFASRCGMADTPRP